jgi:hypothetical protein
MAISKINAGSLSENIVSDINVYTKSEVDNAVGLKADQSITYTKSEVDTAIANIPAPSLSSLGIPNHNLVSVDTNGWTYIFGPASTSALGTSGTGLLRVGEEVGGNGLEISTFYDGTNPTHSYIQSKFLGSAAQSYPLSLNPSGGNVGIGTSTPKTPLHLHYAMANLGDVFNGTVTGTINNNSGVVLWHKLGQSKGGRFSGDLIVQSWTGAATVNLDVACRYSDDSINLTINKTSYPPNIAKTTLQLVTCTYNGENYLAFKKNGGGTGIVGVNAYLSNGGTMAEPFEVLSTSVSNIFNFATVN